MSQRTTVALLAISAVVLAMGGMSIRAQQPQGEEIARRVKTKVAPIYPELARKMNISGTVKVEVVVAPNGAVKEARVVGGHPVLASSALDAVKKWRFEAAPVESTGVIDFKFEPH